MTDEQKAALQEQQRQIVTNATGPDAPPVAVINSQLAAIEAALQNQEGTI